MNLDTSMKASVHLITFPFHDPRWKNKLLIGSLLSAAAFIVPILPWLPVFGYCARLTRAGANNEDAASLPEWDDWGELFADGLRQFVAGMVVMLPSLLVMMVGMLAYFFVFALSIFSDVSRETGSAGAGMFIFLPIVIMMLAWVLTMFLGMVSQFLLPVVNAHVAVKKRISAIFEIDVWWRLLRLNIQGFLVVVIVWMLLYYVLMFVASLLYMTLILCMILPFIIAPGVFFMTLIYYRLSGQAYGRSVAIASLTEAESANTAALQSEPA